MLNCNQKMFIIFRDADILTARNWNSLNGLHGTVAPTSEQEQRKIDKLKGLKTYSEIKATGTNRPYIEFMAQFST